MGDVKSRAAFLLNLSGAKCCQKTEPTRFLPRDASSWPPPPGAEHTASPARRCPLPLQAHFLGAASSSSAPDGSVHLHPTPNEETGGISSSLISSEGAITPVLRLADWQARAPRQENSAALNTRGGAAAPTQTAAAAAGAAQALPLPQPTAQPPIGCRHRGGPFAVCERTASAVTLRESRSLTPCLVCWSGL